MLQDAGATFCRGSDLKSEDAGVRPGKAGRSGVVESRRAERRSGELTADDRAMHYLRRLRLV